MKRSSPRSIRIDENTLLKVQTLHRDPITGRMRYGSLNSLINKLLLDWAIKQTIDRSNKQEDVTDL